MTKLKITPYGLQKLKEFQGCYLTAVTHGYGVYCIGYGLTAGAKRGLTITQEQADKDYEEYLLQLEEAVERALEGVTLRDYQWDAVICFIESIGMHNFRKSELRNKILKNPDNPKIFTEFGRWLKAGKKNLYPLARRRAWEASRYMGND